MERIVLASQSPRRKQLLQWAEIDFDIVVPETDEQFPASISLEDAPVFIARNKALAVQQSIQTNRVILAADTVVLLHNQLIGKPKHREEAIQMLSEISDNRHQVITGVVIVKGDKEIAFKDTTTVSFHALTAAQISFYVDKYAPYDKAGAYAIQEWIGVVGIQSIEGDFYNVMGLPVSRVVKALQEI